MPQTRVSSKFQVVIPKEVREQVGLETGQVLEVVVQGGTITLVPDRPLTELRGFLAGKVPEGYRDKADRL